MNPLLIRRRGMMGAQGGGLPYDAEIEYLQCSGAQWIDTGIAPVGAIIEGTSVVSFDNKNDIMGVISVYGTNSTRYYLIEQQTSMILCCKFSGNWNTSKVAKVTNYNAKTFYTIKGTMTTNNVKIEVGSLNNTYTQTNTTTDTRTFALMARHSTNVERFLKGKMKSPSISVDGVLVRDYIAVRVGTVGYMYDRVSGQLFGNAGTGDFILGPDIQ